MTDREELGEAIFHRINVREFGFMIQSLAFGMFLGDTFRWPSILPEFAFVSMVVGTIIFWYGESKR